MNHDAIYTVGYEGKSLGQFVDLLQRQGVTRVVDVRALPLSRRRGFSKTALREALASAAIDYVHLRAAGNPYRAQREDIANCLRLYRQHLESNPEVVALVEEAVEGHRAALLCLEADPTCCHRSLIAERIRARSPRRPVTDL